MSSPHSRRNALTPEEDERVREGVRKLLREGHSQRGLAAQLGVSQQTISRHLSGFPAGPHLAEKVAAALHVPYKQLVRGEEEREERATEPALRNLPGWAEAEAEARRRFRHIPAEVFDAIGGLKTAKPPTHISPEFIASLAHSWTLAYSRAEEEAQELDEELAAIRRQQEKPGK